MSRIPIPAHSPSYNRSAGAPRAASPIPFPAERALSPLPPSRHQTAASMSTLSGSPADTRKKQNRRDEAIRKKIESELSRKRTISTTQLQSAPGRRRRDKPNVQKGTVAALKPSPALTVPENITVSEASQLCAAKRTDCVLVVDDDEGLSGIFTAKDLAYRVSAEGLDPHVTPVNQIMTRNPMVTRDTTSATEALQLMVQRHFRHLPVCNEEGNVVGLLDITKVFHEALDKVERSSSASEKLYSALAGVQSELGSGLGANPQAAAMLSYVEALREKTALPDLTTVMDSRTQPATVGPKTTVREVAKLMKERRTTAVCVMEPAAPGQPGPAKIAGIFTSKDIVLRVIAAGLDATRCSVVRVMTPHPDTAPPTLTCHDALKKMHNGHYLNLPVVEADGRLVAIVDVLKLTYATLEQMNAMSASEAGGENEAEGGPMWGRFFESLGANEDTESMLSGSHYHTTDTHSQSRRFSSSMRNIVQSPHSEVHPNDSASVVDDDQESALAGYPKDKNPSIAGPPAPIPPVDDGTYVFKFRTPSGRTHRFQARHDNVETLREIVAGKLATDPYFTGYKTSDPSELPPDPTDFTLSYTDEDGDIVLITSDTDVSDAVKIARASHIDRVVLFIQGGRGWATAVAEKSAAQAEAVAAAAALEGQEVEKSELMTGPPTAFTLPTPSLYAPTPSVYAPPPYVPQPPPAPEMVMGIPKDLLLPASIGALAAVILGVFTISRLTR
ncbi:CBS-domain-containing protein [Trametes gibbosa]|nr:CBS-domain-containing protein [Trametes gibbosa]